MRHRTAIHAVALLVVFSVGLGCIGLDDRLQVRGSGVAATDERQLEPFSELKIEGSVNAKVTIGDAQRVTVEADDNIVPIIETRVEGEKLRIRATDSYSAKTPVRVTITVPRLRAVAVDGSGDVAVEGLAGGDSFAVAIDGSGDVTASGTAQAVTVAVGGSGDVNLANVQAKTGKVAIAGSGDVTIHAADALEVSVAGSGDVKYLGDPKLTKSVTGSGRVSKGG